MIFDHPAVLAQLIGFGLFLWVGLYLLVRGARATPLMLVSIAGLFAQACFFGFGALADTRTDPNSFVAIERWSLWTMIVPAAAWFHFSRLVAHHSDPAEGMQPIFSQLVVVAYTAAALLTLFGSISDLINDFAHPIAIPQGYVLRAGPAYDFYMLYITLTASGAFANLVRARRALAQRHDLQSRALMQQIGVLAVGAVAFLAGALWLMVRKNWDLPITVMPGFLGLFGGLAALGYGVAHFGLLLDGQNIQRDFVYNLTGIVILNLLYGGLLSLAGPASAESALALIALVTFTHTTFDVGRTLLDQLFFSTAERAARAEARDYATALGTTPIAAPERAPESQSLDESPDGAELATEAAEPADDQRYKIFQNQVRKALTSLKSPPQVAKSPLLTLDLIEQRVIEAGHGDNRLNRAAALRELLLEQIERLRPEVGDDAAHHVGEAWRFYNVLYYPYVRELSRKSALAEARRRADERRRAGQRAPGELEQVLSWLADVDEDTFYKWQRRASDTIAAILWEEQSERLGR
jgi:hypothetical protein